MLTAIGEFVDIVDGVHRLEDVTEKDVFLNYSLKTARYTFQGPLVLGAILAGASPAEIKKLSAYGLLVGQAFQIQDDVIGMFGSEDKIGKSILSDLTESKKTLLACRAARTLKGGCLREFKKIFEKKTKNLKDLEKVRTIFTGHGILDSCQKDIWTRLNEAQKILRKLNLSDSARHSISDAVQHIFP